jgi:hypothetical protein
MSERDPIKSYEKEIERIGSLTKLLVLITIIMGLTGIFFSIYINSARAEPKEWVLWCETDSIRMTRNGKDAPGKISDVPSFVVEPEGENAILVFNLQGKAYPQRMKKESIKLKEKEGFSFFTFTAGKPQTDDYVILITGIRASKVIASVSASVSGKDGVLTMDLTADCEWQPRK